MSAAYTLPKVWTWDSKSNSTSTNRPIAGATHKRELPVGKHPLQLYSLASPNGQKVTILLEELLEAGIGDEYDAWLVKISDGEQFGSGFVEVNPNSKVPALMDYSTNPAQRVFESGSILVYLAEKYDSFLSSNHSLRTETLNWLFWQMGSAPFLGGGFGHFYSFAPEKIKYAIDRYAMETKRQLDVLDKHLAQSHYMSGNDYSIADMAIWPWYGQLLLGEFYDGATIFLDTASYTHIKRWGDEIFSRPAVKRGISVNKIWGEVSQQLPERHGKSDFDALAIK